VSRFENAVKVIRHQADTENLHPMTLLTFSNQGQESFAVLRLVEYRRTFEQLSPYGSRHSGVSRLICGMNSLPKRSIVSSVKLGSTPG